MSGSRRACRPGLSSTTAARSGCGACRMRSTTRTTRSEREDSVPYDSILGTIGGTPHVRINRLYDPRVSVWFKQERANPGGSIKDRIALGMIEDAEKEGLIGPGSVFIERRRLMKAYGAELELTPRELGMKGAIARANELQADIPKAWIPMQFENLSNVEFHRRTTAAEIARDFPDGLDYLITGVGTGGHITGCAEVLKPLWPGLKVFAVEPTLSPVLSGGTHSPHP